MDFRKYSALRRVTGDTEGNGADAAYIVAKRT
jgi:hypothetical protein